MKRIIHLTKETTIRAEDLTPIIILPNENVVFEIETFYNLSETFITFRNGDKKVISRLNGEIINVPKDLIYAGLLTFSIDMYIEGEKAKHWEALPIRIEEVEGDETKLKIYDQILELEARVAELEKRTKIIY